MKWWFSYLEKLVRKLFNCCHVACGEKKKKKKKDLDSTSVSDRGKRNRTNITVLFTYPLENYLFFIFICIYSVFMA